MRESIKESVKKNIFFLIFIFIISLIVRAFVFYLYLSKNSNYWQVDSNTYNLIAKQIYSNKGLTLPPDDRPDFYRLPVYPIFLAIGYKFIECDTQKVLWFQIILASLIPILIFLLSLIIFPKNIFLAKCASCYSAIHLGLVLYSGFFMTETLFIFLFLLFLILFFSSKHLFFCTQKEPVTLREYSHAKDKFTLYYWPDFMGQGPDFIAFQEELIEQEKLKDFAREICKDPIYNVNIILKLFLSGVFLGLASLVRPVGQYLIILSLILIIFSNDIFKDKLIKIFSLILSWGWVISFWLVRNYLLTGYIFFHTLPGGHFLYLSAARVYMHVNNCSYQEARKDLYQEVQKRIKNKEDNLKRDLQEIEKCYVHESLAREYFLSHPIIALKNWGTDMFRTVFSLYSSELLYLDSGRRDINYFDKGRGVKAMLMRYVYSDTKNILLKIIIYIEIILLFLLYLGIFLGFLNLVFYIDSIVMCRWVMCFLYIFLFVFLALSGGYARMRLPVEPLLMILSLSYWLKFFRRDKNEYV